MFFSFEEKGVQIMQRGEAKCKKGEINIKWRMSCPSSSPAYVRIEGDDRKHVLSGS